MKNSNLVDISHSEKWLEELAGANGPAQVFGYLGYKEVKRILIERGLYERCEACPILIYDVFAMIAMNRGRDCKLLISEKEYGYLGVKNESGTLTVTLKAVEKKTFPRNAPYGRVARAK